LLSWQWPAARKRWLWEPENFAPQLGLIADGQRHGKDGCAHQRIFSLSDGLTGELEKVVYNTGRIFSQNPD
jgi:hypothetical protein